MALFLTRMAVPAGATLGTGADQGFTDIAGKSTEIQPAINQIKQLGITVGKTATTFAPDDYHTREEMALFISRLLKAAQVGPGGNWEYVSGTSGAKEIKSNDTDHNYTDLGTVTLVETQTAIKSLWNLGVTEVTTATLYSPNVNISRPLISGKSFHLSLNGPIKIRWKAQSIYPAPRRTPSVPRMVIVRCTWKAPRKQSASLIKPDIPGSPSAAK